MSIDHYVDKIKSFPGAISPYFRIVCIVLIAFILLGMWQLHALASSKTALQITNTGIIDNMEGVSQTVIASKTGTKYYFPWCGALKRINPANQISFATPTLARQSGYQPAGNCKGVR